MPLVCFIINPSHKFSNGNRKKKGKRREIKSENLQNNSNSKVKIISATQILSKSFFNFLVLITF